MYDYFNHVLAKWQCGFHKDTRTQHVHLVKTENFQKCWNKWSISLAIFTDLSKTFDCISQDLSIANFATDSFANQSHGNIDSFLSSRKQRTKGSNVFIYLIITYLVPQGSVMGPLHVNIYICSIFLHIAECDAISYVVDNTPCNFNFSLDNANFLLSCFRKPMLINIIS